MVTFRICVHMCSVKLHVAPVQHLQEDPEQVEADEAAAAKCLGLSPY
jgi:hypothetical protein